MKDTKCIEMTGGSAGGYSRVSIHSVETTHTIVIIYSTMSHPTHIFGLSTYCASRLLETVNILLFTVNTFIKYSKNSR